MKNTLLEILNMNFNERQQYMETNGDELLQNMLVHIGHPNDELRDKLNYRVFIELLSEQLITPEQMKQLALTIHGKDYLYSSIGDRQTDTVFTRSFSAIWLTALLHVDRQLHFLSDMDATLILEASTPYLMNEKDVRGFVGQEQGWAHAIAHGAELANAIVNHPAFEIKLASKLLQGIKDSFWKDSVFVDDEDERLVTIIEALINRDFPEDVLVEWVEQVFDKLQFYLMEVGYTPQYFSARTNTLHFMKTLYFSLKFSNKMPQLKGVVTLFIAKWMKQ